MSKNILADLEETIIARKGAAADESYTATLLAKGIKKSTQKFGEEAFEFAIAASAEDDAALTSEAADVLYHMLVVLAARGVPFQDVLDALQKRRSQSGHAEKASRKK